VIKAAIRRLSATPGLTCAIAFILSPLSRQRNALNIAVARSYVAGTAPFPERAAVLSVVGSFHADFADMVNAWADWATTTIETWPEDASQAEADWAFMKRLARRDPVKMR
jgi:hypothetical protein